MSFLRQLFSKPEPVPQKAPVFSIPQNTRLYAVGDIHGRKGLLANMLSTIEQDAGNHPGKRIIEVFLGDYIDRGLHSKEVIDLLLKPSANGHERICLLGNHEEVLLQFLKDPKVLRDWANFGGYATLASYGVVIPHAVAPGTIDSMRDTFQRNLPTNHFEFLKNLRLTYDIGDYLFVHAGILPKVALHEQKPEDFLWIREPFLKYAGFFGHYVVHGHTPVTKPDIRMNRANLDITAAPSNSLCCLVVEGTERNVLTVTHQGD